MAARLLYIKKQILEDQMKKISKLIIFAVLMTALASCGNSSDKYSRITPDNGVINIPVSSVSDGNAHYFTHKINGKEIKFFVLQSNDGTIRAAFDACDVCFPEKKGYRQDGDFMVCNNCGQKFHESRINLVKGGCNPSPLARKTDGNTLQIAVSDIASGARYF